MDEGKGRLMGLKICATLLALASPAFALAMPMVDFQFHPERMTDATDVRRSAEFPRLSLSGEVDIGCYQCWLPPVGALLIVK